VRHVTCASSEQITTRAEDIALAREIMRADVEAYGHQFPAYPDNPVAEPRGHSAGSRPMIALPATMRHFLRDTAYGEAQILRRRSPRHRLWLIA
jgi:hypothetical protein